jgi:branched-subunit amino acid transport protein
LVAIAVAAWMKNSLLTILAGMLALILFQAIGF